MFIRTARYTTTIIILLSIVLLGAANQAEKIQVWPEHTNVYGSPDGYYYIASVNSLKGYSQAAMPILTHKLNWTTKIFASPKGNYWASGKFDDEITVDYDLTQVDVYTPSGTKLYTLKNPDALKFVLNDRSPAMVGVNGVEGLPEAGLTFYDDKGQELTTYKLTQYTGAAFSANADYFLAHSADSGLYVFTPRGELEYRFLISPYYGVSENGLTVVSIDGSRMNSHFRDSRAGSVPTSIVAPKAVRITPDSKHVIVMDKQKVYCFNLTDLSPVWEYALEKSNESFSTISISPDSHYIALGIMIDSGPGYSIYDRYNTGRVEVLDSAGQKIAWGDLEYSSWSAGYPKVEFSSDNKKVWILSHFELFQLDIE